MLRRVFSLLPLRLKVIGLIDLCAIASLFALRGWITSPIGATVILGTGGAATGLVIMYLLDHGRDLIALARVPAIPEVDPRLNDPKVVIFEEWVLRKARLRAKKLNASYVLGDPHIGYFTFDGEAS